MFNLLRFDKKAKYLSIDFETESLNLNYSRPWQVGFSIFENGKYTLQENIYIKWPNLKMCADAARITRFSQETYNREGLDNKKVLELYESYLNNPEYIILGYNYLNFDIYQYNTWRRFLGYSPNYQHLDRTIDVHCLAKAFKMGIKPPTRQNKDEFLRFMYQMADLYRKGVKTSLRAICKDFNLEYDDDKAHEGLYDALRTQDVFNQLVWKLDI